MNGPLRILSLVAGGICLPALAQTVFTPGNAIPGFGQYEFTGRNRDTQPAAPIDTNATTGVWDFSATTFPGISSYEVSIMPAASTAHWGEYPTADICRVNHYAWGDYYSYYRNGPDTLTYLGEATVLTGDPEVYLAPACRTAPFLYPAAVGDIHTEDVTDCQGPVNGLPSSWRRKILATGTFLSSVLTVEDAILVMDHLDNFNEQTTPPTPLRVTRFLWFQPGNAIDPVATWYPYDEINQLFINILSPVTGIAGNGNDHPVHLFPNPTEDRITVQSRDGGPLGEVSIFSVDGCSVCTARANTDRMELDVRSLAPGLYNVVCRADGQRTALRFVKE